MLSVDIAYGLIFQTFGLRIDNPDNYRISQKKIFLLQEMGCPIGFSYIWYTDGPYSPDLADYMEENFQF